MGSIGINVANGDNGQVSVPSKAPQKSLAKEKKIKSKANHRKTKDRDGSCRYCGSTQDLTVHHIKYRSEGGDDRMGNLLTLCDTCHRYAHDGFYKISKGARFYISGRDFVLSILESLGMKLYNKAIEHLKSKTNEVQDDGE